MATLLLIWLSPADTAQEEAANPTATVPSTKVPSTKVPSKQEALQRFESADKYALEVDGESSPAAQTFVSLAAGSELLVKAPELALPLLITPRGKSLHRVPLNDLQSREQVLELAHGLSSEPVGTYTIEGTSLVWNIDGLRMQLTERHLFGLHDAATLGTWDPEYVRRSHRYTPSQAILESLAATAEETRVRVYFGSWCPRCGHAVPRWMRLAAELADSKLRFEFFGMPRLEADAPETFWPEAKAAGAYEDEVTIVPLAIVFRGVQRLGRITSGWSQPERELEKILDAPPDEPPSSSSAGTSSAGLR